MSILGRLFESKSVKAERLRNEAEARRLAEEAEKRRQAAIEEQQAIARKARRLAEEAEKKRQAAIEAQQAIGRKALAKKQAKDARKDADKRLRARFMEELQTARKARSPETEAPQPTTELPMILDLSAMGLFVETELLPHALGEKRSHDSTVNDIAAAVVASAFNGRTNVPVRACIDHIMVPAARAYDSERAARVNLSGDQIQKEATIWLATGGHFTDEQSSTTALFVVYYAYAKLGMDLSNAVLAALARELITAPQVQWSRFTTPNFSGTIWTDYEPSDVVHRILMAPTPGAFAASLMNAAVKHRVSKGPRR